MPTIDVRDLATVFYNAINDQNAKLERYIAVTNILYLEEILEQMSESYICHGYPEFEYRYIPKSLLVL